MKTLLLITLQLTASGMDGYYTHKAQLNHRSYENDPIARPFIHHTTQQVLYFSTTASIQIAIPIILRKHHHNKLADIMAVGGIVDNTCGVIQTKTHVRE